jgi:ubiquinone/menaquinone biosynthesis C-methylase UbiE
MSDGRSPDDGAPPYSLTSRIYDQVYAGKDYAAEARRIRQWVRRYGPARPRSLLDVACGSGSHLAYLARHFDATGVDLNEGMLRLARRKLPRVRFVRGRMESFRLAERFDVITCLFSAIGYVRSERDLRRTVANFARHLNPGGVVIVEPWLSPEVYRAGEVHVGTYGDPKFPIVRMHLSRRHGNRSMMDMHHLVGTPRGVRHWVEHHDLGMFDVPTFLSAFRGAGLRGRYLRNGLMRQRGVYIAVLPRPAGTGRPARGRRRAGPTPVSSSSPRAHGS